MIIYVELVFLENFAVDCFLLLISGKITNQKCKHVFLASVFGAVYACLCLCGTGLTLP
ncbi:MAG: sigma-E processing peptidase SpoIIGA [Clostridia bacterium]|nr:sigma-E processing peptidase SpoIIGA [Clostridia bacterium]